MSRAIAHPNIALVKYWGKAETASNIPAVPSLSVTLDTFISETEVTAAKTDSVVLDGRVATDSKITDFLATVRAKHELPPLRIDSRNNFPTAAGLASSASGFAALVLALNAEFDLGWDDVAIADWARIGSGSAPRSLFGPMAQINGPDWIAKPVDATAMPELAVVVAITSKTRKTTSSSAGMAASKSTSPYFEPWVATAEADMNAARQAIAAGNFDALATVAEHSCMKMHALMLSTRPSLRYWNPTTLACLDAASEMQQDGLRVFCTVDAGPQLKAICTEDVAGAVAARLESIDGVLDVHVLGLGPGARVVA
ncbi:MAG: diphosphomevalonate decarboxylase [Pseudomonadaceae bacterium]|nr:diphosphomevalonate decarboxylase [Pseudomonadaceae bacterium]